MDPVQLQMNLRIIRNQNVILLALLDLVSNGAIAQRILQASNETHEFLWHVDPNYRYSK